MLIGIKTGGINSRWSTYRGYWTDYVVKLEDLTRDKDSGGLDASGYQEYTPVMTTLLHRWYDDC